MLCVYYDVKLPSGIVYSGYLVPEKGGYKWLSQRNTLDELKEQAKELGATEFVELVR